MRWQIFYIAPALLFSLFIYLFFRTEKTLVNEIALSLSPETFYLLRNEVQLSLSFNPFVIYSLPEGLWVFCITLTSANLYIKIGGSKIHCIIFPLVFAVGLELLQLFKITSGRFDPIDIIISLCFSALAYMLVRNKLTDQQLFNQWNARSFICLLSYGIVYLSHVCK